MITTVIRLYTDGACSGNPGPGAIGIVILDEQNQELETHKECLGHTTNNRAEYHALIKGLDIAAKHCRKKVLCFLDSDIVVKQLNGQYRLKNDELRKLFHAVKDKERAFEEVIYTHVHRTNSFIKRADSLTKLALSPN